MLKKIRLLIVVALVFMFTQVSLASDMNSFIESKILRKAVKGPHVIKGHTVRDKDGNGYIVPATEISAEGYKRTGSCDYTWSVNVPLYDGPGSPIGTKIITGTGKKIQSADVGTVSFVRTEDGKKYIKIKKSAEFKNAIMNGDITALDRLNQITSPLGYYYKAVVYMGQVRDIRTGEVRAVKKVSLKRVKSAGEATIEDLTVGGGTGGGSGSGDGGSGDGSSS
jgi:hypothetical protein